MILLLVPLLCAALGAVLYFALRATGTFGVFAGSGATATASSGTASRRAAPPSSLRERIQETPPGWLIAVIALCGVWILGWLVVLFVGLSLLS